MMGILPLCSQEVQGMQHTQVECAESNLEDNHIFYIYI